MEPRWYVVRTVEDRDEKVHEREVVGDYDDDGDGFHEAAALAKELQAEADEEQEPDEEVRTMFNVSMW